MKAAVVSSFGTAPRYEDFPAPVPSGPDEILVDVVAAGQEAAADPVRHRDIALTVVEDRKFQPVFPLKLAVAVGNGLMRDGNERCTARTDVRRRIAKVL